jgi:hypothetical protein
MQMNWRIMRKTCSVYCGLPAVTLTKQAGTTEDKKTTFCFPELNGKIVEF